MFKVDFDDYNDEAHVYEDGKYFLTVKYSLLPLRLAKRRIRALFDVPEHTVCKLDFDAPQAGACET